MSFPLHEPVIVIVVIDEPFRREHGLSPDAVMAVVELFEGSAFVCCTDCDARQASSPLRVLTPRPRVPHSRRRRHDLRGWPPQRQGSQ